MRVCAIGNDRGVLVGQHLRGKLLDAFGRDVQRTGDVRFAITFGRERLNYRDLFLVNFGFQVFGRNCAVHFDLLGKHSSSMREAVSPIRVRNSCGSLGLDLGQSEYRRLGSATDTIPLPQPKPRAVSEHFVVPSICIRDVACAEWSNVRRFEHFL
jgi:hypothetical protein